MTNISQNPITAANGLLNSESLSELPKNKIINKFIIGAVATLAIGGGALYLTGTSNNNSKLDNASFITSLKNKVSSTNNESKNIENNIETNFPINENSTLVNKENKEILNKIGNFNLDKKLADNQIARKVSQIQFTSENYFLALVSEGEGFKSTIYNDNIGFAFGNGWNISMQNSKYNTQLATAISKDSQYINKIASLSGKMSDGIPQNNLVIAPQNSMQIAFLMGSKFENGVINGIAQKLPKNELALKIHKSTNKSYLEIAKELYQNLAPNEQGAVLYHCYKVGEAGFAKYNGMLGSLIEYGLSDNKTEEMRKNVADKFTYKYKLNGQVLEDTRAAILVGGMFADKTAFGYLIGKNVAPHNIAKLTYSFQKFNIDGKAKPGEQIVPDDLGKEKEKIKESGGKINLMLLPEKNPADSIKSLKNKSVPYGYGIMG